MIERLHCYACDYLCDPGEGAEGSACPYCGDTKLGRVHLLSAADADGTKMERQRRLVAIAKLLGFPDATEAFWDQHNPESGLDMITDVADGAVDVDHPVDQGVYLHSTVFVRTHFKAEPREEGLVEIDLDGADPNNLGEYVMEVHDEPQGDG